MKIKRFRAHPHPNLYSHRPVVVMRLELEPEDELLLTKNPDFSARREYLQPETNLYNSRMRSIRTVETKITEAVKNGAVNLKHKAGFGSVGGCVRFSGDPGIYEIAVEYDNESAAMFFLETAVAATEAALAGKPFDINEKLSKARAEFLPGNGKNSAEPGRGNSPGKINQNPKVPVIAVTGTNGKTTVTRLIAHLLLETDRNVGTTTTEGILFNGELIESGDTTGPASARVVLRNKKVEIAVLETARGGILRRGLGWDWADIGVITNITEDHIGQDGIETLNDLVDIKSLIAERVRPDGTLVLNADDPESAVLVNRPSVREIEKNIVYFTMSEQNPIVRNHINAGGTCYSCRDSRIYEHRAAETKQIIEADKIPVTMNGTAEFQIQNVMAAIAVSRLFDLTVEKIKAALYNFRNEIHNPGRNNFYRVGKGFALIDYGHNPKAIESICRMTARWRDKIVTGIISFPGDRRDDVIKAAGRIAVAGFNRIIIKGDTNLRGRKKGEVAEMLRELVVNAGNQNECQIALDAEQAFEDAIARIEENEVVVFFYEKLEPALATLKKYGAVPADGFQSS